MPVIKLDKKRHFALNLTAVIKFEELTGKRILNAGTLETLSSKEWSTLIWVGLLKDDPTLTEEQVADMVHISHLPTVIAAIAEDIKGGKKDENPLGSTGES